MPARDAIFFLPSRGEHARDRLRGQADRFIGAITFKFTRRRIQLRSALRALMSRRKQFRSVLPRHRNSLRSRTFGIPFELGKQEWSRISKQSMLISRRADIANSDRFGESLKRQLTREAVSFHDTVGE